MTICKNCQAEFAWWEKNCPICGTSTGGISFLKGRRMLSWLRVVLLGFAGICFADGTWLAGRILFGLNEGRLVARIAGFAIGILIALIQRYRAMRPRAPSR